MTYEEELALYEEALRAILAGQEYQIGTMRLRRANIEHVQNRIDYLRQQVAIQSMGSRTYVSW